MNYKSKKNKTCSVLYKICLSATALLFTLPIVANKEPVKAKELDYDSNLARVLHKSFLENGKIKSLQGRPRIAVLDFDLSRISRPGLIRRGMRGISDILTNKLVQSGLYRVIERSQIEAVFREQNLGASGRVDPTTAARIGKLLGVKMIIIGSVTEFDADTKREGFRVWGYGGSSYKTQANVRLNVRVVDTTTGEILMVAEGKGEANDRGRASISVYGFSGSSESPDRDELLATATEEAIEEVVNQLNSHYQNTATFPRSVRNRPRVANTVKALVADVTGTRVILNKGSAHGFRVGMKVSIERVVRQVKDPETGRVIREITEKIGEIKLIDVDNKSSEGRIVSSNYTFQVGDIALLQ